MKTPLKYSFLFIFISIVSITIYGQNNSIGINTINPNPNAVLELISPNNNQGLLIPRLTTGQRTALTSFAQSEQGLLVYDISLQNLYWWNGSAWNTTSGLTYLPGTGITIDANNIISGFDGNYNSLTNLPVLFSGDYNNLINKPTIITYTAGAGINISSSNSIINSLPDQIVSLTGAGSTSISGRYPNFTVLSNDAQNMSISGNAISIDGGTGFNLSAIAPASGDVLTWNNTLNRWESSAATVNTDAQSLSLSGNKLSITGSTGTVNLAGYLDNTDAQNMSIAGNEISIVGGTGYNLSATAPSDGQVLTWNNTLKRWESSSASVNTDAQNISISGNAVSIVGGTGYNISATAPTDGQVLTWNNTLSRWESSSASVNTDAQAISLSANVLSITGSAGTVNLAGYLDNTDAQNMSITGNAVTIVGGTGYNLSATDPTNGQVLTWNNSLSRWESSSVSVNTDAQAISLLADILSITGNAGTVNLAGYKELPPQTGNAGEFLTTNGTTPSWSNFTEVDGSVSNEIQNLSWNANGNEILISSGTSINLSATMPIAADVGKVLTWNGTKWDALNSMTYVPGTGINITGNVINSLWANASGSDVILANSTSNVGIGADPLAGYKLFVNGKLQTAGINELSDRRWKTEINSIENSLDLVKQLQGVTYKWNIENFPDKNFETGIQMGLIAQEVEKIVPYIVDTDQNGFKSVEYSHLVALFVEAIKEQQLLIENQQNEIKTLNNSNTDISDKYKSIETKLEKQQAQIKLLLKYMESSNTVQQTSRH